MDLYASSGIRVTAESPDTKPKAGYQGHQGAGDEEVRVLADPPSGEVAAAPRAESSAELEPSVSAAKAAWICLQATFTF